MPHKISLIDSILPSPPIILAPMAGITDLPFRKMVARFGAGLLVSEMVASQEVVQARPQARTKAGLGPGHTEIQGAHSVQIAGRDPYWMAEAARLLEAEGAQMIDINMGCPAKRVTSGYSGSALMRDPDHALRLIEAVVGAVRLPVTLKTRLGWNEDLMNAPEIAKRAEDAGIRMITIHGRTRCQFYKGTADWAAIRDTQNAVSIPVIANGDITGPAAARRARSLSGAAGVMIGRAARGRPWLLAEIAHHLHQAPKPHLPQGSALADLITEHYEDQLLQFGRDIGLRAARKHLSWYLQAAGEAATLALPNILRNDCPTQVIQLIRGACADSITLAAA